MLGNDGLAEMHVDKPRGRELGGAIGERSVECSLVVIVPVCCRVVLSTDVNYCVAGLEKCWVARADEVGVLVGWQQAQHVDRESFVGVEVPIVSSNGNTIELNSFCCYFCHLGYAVSEHICMWRELDSRF